MQKKRPSRREMAKNNQVVIIGKIKEEFFFDHEWKGEEFYVTTVAVKRQYDSSVDTIPLMITKKVKDEKFSGKEYVRKKVEIIGQFRSHNKWGKDRKSHLKLFCFAQKIDFIDSNVDDKDEIFLRGFICKKPVYRITPKSKTPISDLLIAVNRKLGKSDYLPCIAWNANAVSTAIMNVGDCVEIEGRIQSRIYHKGDEWNEAYEISIITIKKIEE